MWYLSGFSFILFYNEELVGFNRHKANIKTTIGRKNVTIFLERAVQATFKMTQ